MEYVRQPVPPIPGLTAEETLEFHRINVEGAMFGYHSLGPEKYQRMLELQMKMSDGECTT